MTTFDEYDKQSEGTDISPKTIEYYMLGLTGEAGEAANELKKVLRDKGGNMDVDSREKILSELGDCMWYISRLGTLLGTPLEAIALMNLMKLKKRHKDLGEYNDI